MTHENVPSSKRSKVSRETSTEDVTGNEAEEMEVSEEIQDSAGDNPHPTSSDAGKQTLTKADLGYDVTQEGVPSDEEALATSQHPGDPSAKEETQRNPGMAGSESK